jgi:hypothetical protein
VREIDDRREESLVSDSDLDQSIPVVRRVIGFVVATGVLAASFGLARGQLEWWLVAVAAGIAVGALWASRSFQRNRAAIEHGEPYVVPAPRSKARTIPTFLAVAAGAIVGLAVPFVVLAFFPAIVLVLLLQTIYAQHRWGDDYQRLQSQLRSVVRDRHRTEERTIRLERVPGEAA